MRVTDSNGMDVAYKYDPMGRRIEKNVLGQVTRYFYDSEDIAFEYSGNGTTGNIYIHGPGIDEPLGLRQSKGAYYYHADGLGSIIGITDASASLVQSYEYDSFGNLKDRKNRIKQPYAYTGREYDRETGLYYYRARYYMPEIGRFIQEDPIKFRSGDVNWYAYVENRPINYIDPWGYWGYASEYGTTGDGLTAETLGIEGTVDSVYNEIISTNATVTYTTNGTHSANSLHNAGNAIDLRVWGMTGAQITQAVNQLITLLGDDFDVINEGDHIHIEYDPPCN